MTRHHGASRSITEHHGASRSTTEEHHRTSWSVTKHHRTLSQSIAEHHGAPRASRNIMEYHRASQNITEFHIDRLANNASCKTTLKGKFKVLFYSIFWPLGLLDEKRVCVWPTNNIGRQTLLKRQPHRHMPTGGDANIVSFFQSKCSTVGLTNGLRCYLDAKIGKTCIAQEL